MRKLYLIGSLRNPAIPEAGARLRRAGFDVFDDWFAAGPEADDKWRLYERSRGRTYFEALQGEAATHVFGFDRKFLDRCDLAVLFLPAGRSGHLEAGYLVGQGKPVYAVLNGDADRWDVMYRFLSGVFVDLEDLLDAGIG